MAASQARADLRKKIILERDLQTELRKFNKRLVSKTVRAEAQPGVTFIAEAMTPELDGMLRDHYSTVGGVFDHQISDTLPADIAESPEERAIIVAALGQYYDGRAPVQASIINRTNKRDMNASLAQANTIVAEQALEGEVPTVQGTALIAGAILSRKLEARVSGIANMETQTPAEVAKLTEAQVLTGVAIAIIAGTSQKSDVRKEWVTAGDEKVRPAHSSADSQFRDMNDNFSVGGQALAFPGDMGHGATIGNTINCRCDSVVSKDDVYAVRRRKGEDPFIDLTASDQMLTSIGV